MSQIIEDVKPSQVANISNDILRPSAFNTFEWNIAAVSACQKLNYVR